MYPSVRFAGPRMDVDFACLGRGLAHSADGRNGWKSDLSYSSRLSMTYRVPRPPEESRTSAQRDPHHLPVVYLAKLCAVATALTGSRRRDTSLAAAWVESM